jgi:hypothetical protein
VATLSTYYVKRYAAFLQIVPVAAVSPQDALDRVSEGEGDWEAYPPVYSMQLGLEDDGDRRYKPHINDVLLSARVGPPDCPTTWEKLVADVLALSDVQWQQLLSTRVWSCVDSL